MNRGSIRLRLAERRALKRFSHARLMDCGSVRIFCWSCLWREVTGARRRELRALADVARSKGSPVPWPRTDESKERVFEMVMHRAVELHGQIPCPRPHVNLFAGGRCYCGAEV